MRTGLILSAFMAGIFGLWLVAYLLLNAEMPSDSAMWFAAGAATASVPWAMVVILNSVDGSFYWRMGADGEEYTAQELARLGKDWTVRHNIPFASRSGGEVDVDHVAIGPHGVLVVESKMCTTTLHLDVSPLPQKVADAVRQARRNAARVESVFGDGFGAKVIPLVVYWGRAVARPGGGVLRVGDVRVVRGQDADEWRGLLSLVRVSPSDRDAMVALLDQLVADRESAQRKG